MYVHDLISIKTFNLKTLLSTCPTTTDIHTYITKETTNKEGYYMSHGGYGYGDGFALIIVLFILLIIVGATWGYGGHGY